MIIFERQNLVLALYLFNNHYFYYHELRKRI